MPTTKPVRANAVGIVVDDMAASLAFYQRCGLPIPDDADGSSPHVDIHLSDGFRLMLDSQEVARSLDPAWAPPSGSSRVGLALECASVADVDDLHAELVGAGHPSHLDPFDAPWGQRYATVLDPNGVGVDLYAALEG